MFSYYLGWGLILVSLVLVAANFACMMRSNADLQRYLQKKYPESWGDLDENLARLMPVGKENFPSFLFSKEDMGDAVLRRKKARLRRQFLWTFLYIVGTALMVFFVYFLVWHRG